MNKILSMVLITVILCGCVVIPQDIPKLYTKNIPAIVSIYIMRTVLHTGETAISLSGSGFVIDKYKGLIITAAHVIGNNNIRCQVEFNTGLKIGGIVQLINLDNDIAVIKINPNNFSRDIPNLEFELRPVIGERLFCIGNPGKHFGTISVGILSTGLIRNIDPMSFQPSEYYLSDVHIFGGSSGCAVFNMENKIVGMVVQYMSNYALMIPAGSINKVLEQYAN